jgi:hypothetical protein
MTEERLKLINRIADEMKFISAVIEKIEEGYTYEIRLKVCEQRMALVFIRFLSEAQRSEIEDLMEKCIRKNLEDYQKEFEKL